MSQFRVKMDHIRFILTGFTFRTKSVREVFTFRKPTLWEKFETLSARFFFLCYSTRRTTLSFISHHVKSHVFQFKHYLKILYPVVQLVTVNMVDILLRVKRSSKMFLHDMPMFRDRFLIYVNYFVTSRINLTSSFRSLKKTCDWVSLYHSIIMTAAVTFSSVFSIAFGNGAKFFHNHIMYQPNHIVNKNPYLKEVYFAI